MGGLDESLLVRIACDENCARSILQLQEEYPANLRVSGVKLEKRDNDPASSG